MYLDHLRFQWRSRHKPKTRKLHKKKQHRRNLLSQSRRQSKLHRCAADLSGPLYAWTGHPFGRKISFPQHLGRRVPVSSFWCLGKKKEVPKKELKWFVEMLSLFELIFGVFFPKLGYRVQQPPRANSVEFQNKNTVQCGWILRLSADSLWEELVIFGRDGNWTVEPGICSRNRQLTILSSAQWSVGSDRWWPLFLERIDQAWVSQRN